MTTWLEAVPTGAAEIAVCTLVNWPLPSAATTMLVSAAAESAASQTAARGASRLRFIGLDQRSLVVRNARAQARRVHALGTAQPQCGAVFGVDDHSAKENVLRVEAGKARLRANMHVLERDAVDRHLLQAGDAPGVLRVGRGDVAEQKITEMRRAFVHVKFVLRLVVPMIKGGDDDRVGHVFHGDIGGGEIGHLAA